MADVANQKPKPGFAQDSGPYVAASAKVYPPGQEPAKLNAALDTTAGASKDV